MGNDRTARLDRLYAKHHREVLAYFLRRLDPVTAYDAAAEVFVVAWRKLDEVPPGEGALPWLYAVSSRVLSNQRRAAARLSKLIKRVGSVSPNPVAGPEALVMRSDDSRQVRDAMDGLRTRDREILRLVAWEELPRQQIADLLAISRDAVDKRVARALDRLRKELIRTGFTAGPTTPRSIQQGEGG